jgi:hypothetical protein
MNGFLKIPSALKILLIEIFAVFFFPASVAGLVNQIRPGTFAPSHNLKGAEDWIFFPVGPLLLVWILHDIFRPRIKVESWIRIGTFDFCSTHPSYVLIDLLTIAFAGFFVWLGVTARFELAVFRLMLGTAVLIPLARLFAWYALGLKINDPEAREAFWPALWAFAVFTLVFGGIALGVSTK